MTVEIDIAIIGAGIVGLMLAKKLQAKFPKLSIVIFEKNQFTGEESSSRNSGVIHSGIYYETDSFKHQLCVEGNREWEELALKLAIPFNRCGKFIIATTENESQALEQLKTQGEKNGIRNLRHISTAERRTLDALVNIDDAIFLPTTGILDAAKAVKSLTDFLFTKNIPILLKHKIERVEFDPSKFTLYFKHEKISSSILINACGLNSIELRKKLGLFDFESHYIKGNYLSTNQPLFTKSLLYPLPPANLPGLGVHSSFDFLGKVKFGPNTEEITEIDYRVTANLKEQMWPAINQLFKNIDPSKLYGDYSGIRAKIKKVNEQQLYSDFLLQSEKEHKIKNYYEFCGIDSPGLTAAPAIANWMVKQLC